MSHVAIARRKQLAIGLGGMYNMQCICDKEAGGSYSECNFVSHRMEHSTKEMLAGTLLSSGDVSEYTHPTNAAFTLTEDELKGILPEYIFKKRMRLRGGWTSVFREYLLAVTPYTTWHFTDSSCSTLESRKKSAPLLTAHGVCAEPSCNAQIECVASKENHTLSYVPLQVCVNRV